MSERPQASLEERSRTLFHDSVEGLDFAMRSRLTQARAAAIEAASRRPGSWIARMRSWTPAAGVTAAAALGVALWMGSPLSHQAVTVTDGQPNLEDLDIVASSDGNADTMDMLQDDVEFYDWADRDAGEGVSASG